MTLLILGIQVPQVGKGEQLLDKLLPLGPKVLVYVLSFVTLGVYWVGHHNQFFFIKRADRTMLWINILFLTCVAFLPFSAGLLGEYWREPAAAVVYGVNLILCGIALYLHWWYSTSRETLTDGKIDEHVMSIVNRRILTPPAVYTLAIAASFFSTLISIGLYVLIPALYILPGHIDFHFGNHAAHERKVSDAIAKSDKTQAKP